jgi:hypothetical protein
MSRSLAKVIGNGIPFSEMTPPAELKETINSWYDEEHIPVAYGLRASTGPALSLNSGVVTLTRV